MHLLIFLLSVIQSGFHTFSSFVFNSGCILVSMPTWGNWELHCHVFIYIEVVAGGSRRVMHSTWVCNKTVHGTEQLQPEQSRGQSISPWLCFAFGAQWPEVQDKHVCDSGLAVKNQTFPPTEQWETPLPNLLLSLLPHIWGWFTSILPFSSLFHTLCHPCSNSQLSRVISSIHLVMLP